MSENQCRSSAQRGVARMSTRWISLSITGGTIVADPAGMSETEQTQLGILVSLAGCRFEPGAEPDVAITTTESILVPGAPRYRTLYASRLTRSSSPYAWVAVANGHLINRAITESTRSRIAYRAPITDDQITARIRDRVTVTFPEKLTSRFFNQETNSYRELAERDVVDDRTWSSQLPARSSTPCWNKRVG